MKKSVIAVLALSSLLVAGSATAQLTTDVIGIFADADATQCEIVPGAQYSTMTVHFVALLNTIGAMSACEFAATGTTLPAGASAPSQPMWATDLVIGNIDEGVALAFSEPLVAPVAYLGFQDYFLITPALIPADYAMTIVESSAGNILVVDADTTNEIPAEGWSLIANCTPGGPYGDCSCEEGVATEDAAWGQIKALY
jgi:hypothetical protein